MANIDDGGPAFPGGVAGPEYGNQAGNPMEEGMSLRDWFAGQVLAGIVANVAVLVDFGNSGEHISGVAPLCFCIADAMIETRKEKPKEATS